MFKKLFATAAMVALLSSVIALSSPAKVYACSCIAPGDPLTEASRTDAVFTGKVASADYPEDRTGADEVAITVTPDEVFKFDGEAGDEVMLYTSSSSAACGIDVEEGKDYLFYANEYDGKLTVYLCSRTALVADASADLEALRNNDIPASPIDDENTAGSGSDIDDNPVIISDKSDTDEMASVVTLGDMLTMGLLGLNLILTAAVLVKLFIHTKNEDSANSMKMTKTMNKTADSTKM